MIREMIHYWERQRWGRVARLGRNAVVAIVATWTLAAPPGRAQGTLPPVREPDLHTNIVTVTGTAEVKTAPDLSTVRLGVEIEASTAAAATGQEAKTMSAVVDAIRQKGIADRDIQTAEFSLQPVYESGPNVTNPKVRGFRAANIVTVTLHANLDRTGGIVDAGLGAGADRVDSIDFGLENDETVREQAIAQAAQKAQAKAQVLAQALHLQLGGVVAVSEGVAGVPSPMPMMRAMAVEASTPVMAGQVGVSATVTVQYRINP